MINVIVCYFRGRRTSRWLYSGGPTLWSMLHQRHQEYTSLLRDLSLSHDYYFSLCVDFFYDISFFLGNLIPITNSFSDFISFLSFDLRRLQSVDPGSLQTFPNHTSSSLNDLPLLNLPPLCTLYPTPFKRTLYKRNLKTPTRPGSVTSTILCPTTGIVKCQLVRVRF